MATLRSIRARQEKMGLFRVAPKVLLDGERLSRPRVVAITSDKLDLTAESYLGDWPIEARKLTLPNGALAQNLARGIVTGGREIHWQCVGSLILAAHEYGLGFAMADHGLAEWQREEMDRVGVRWIEHQKPSLEFATAMHKNRRTHEVWWKPWICVEAPFARSLWVDADAVLIADPSDVMGDGPPAIAREHLFIKSAVSPNSLKKRLVVKTFGEGQIPEDWVASLAVVNTGVIAFNRHDPWLFEWAAWSALLMNDRERVRLCPNREQTAAMISLIKRMCDGRAIIMLLRDEWNVPANHLCNSEIERRLDVPIVPEAFLRVARERHPDAKVVHWLGSVKPWMLIDKSNPMAVNEV